MNRLREAINTLDPQEAYLVSDHAVELLLRDGRRIRITATEDLKGSGFSADHEVAIDMQQGDQRVTAWGPIALPWADGDSIEECLARAVELISGP